MSSINVDAMVQAINKQLGGKKSHSGLLDPVRNGLKWAQFAHAFDTTFAERCGFPNAYATVANTYKDHPLAENRAFLHKKAGQLIWSSASQEVKDAIRQERQMVQTALQNFVLNAAISELC